MANGREWKAGHFGRAMGLFSPHLYATYGISRRKQCPDIYQKD